MTRSVIVELPDVITVNGMTDAPDTLREIPTANWDDDFCFNAIMHGVSQKQGDAWSVTKKDLVKTQAVHNKLVAGEWTTKARGTGKATNLDSLVDRMSVEEFKAFFEAKMAQKTGK